MKSTAIMKLLALALVLAATPAAAADLSLKAAPKASEYYNWSGFYITGYGQYAVNIDGSTVTATDLAGGTGTLGVGVQKGPGVGGGLTILYQAAASPWVLGVRSTIGYANLTGTSNSFGAPGTAPIALSSATNYMGDFNGILGYTLDPKVLAYVTGGLAFGGAKPNLSVFFMPNALQAAASDTSVGWDVGLGLKYMLTSNIDVFIEGDYIQLGNKSLSITPIGATTPLITSSTPFNFFTQKVGIDFKL